jgi:hypothetical protein
MLKVGPTRSSVDWKSISAINLSALSGSLPSKTRYEFHDQSSALIDQQLPLQAKQTICLAG